LYFTGILTATAFQMPRPLPNSEASKVPHKGFLKAGTAGAGHKMDHWPAVELLSTTLNDAPSLSASNLVSRHSFLSSLAYTTSRLCGRRYVQWGWQCLSQLTPQCRFSAQDHKVASFGQEVILALLSFYRHFFRPSPST
jgi:hypothetical protein